MDYINLFISMIWKSQDNDILFTRKDIESYLEEYNILRKDYNELASIILWEENYITSETFADNLDIVYKDNNFYIYLSSFDDLILSGFDDFEKSVMSHTFDYESSSYNDYDIDFSIFTEETLNSILEYCIKYKQEVEIDDIGIPITKKNTKIKDNKLLINNINISDLMDDLGDLEIELKNVIGEANDSAQRDSIYSAIEDEIENKLGPIEYNDDDIHIRLDVDWTKIKEKLFDMFTNQGEVEFEGACEKFEYVLSEYDIIEFDSPNYDYVHYYAKDKDINEMIQERLLW